MRRVRKVFPFSIITVIGYPRLGFNQCDLIHCMSLYRQTDKSFADFDNALNVGLRGHNPWQWQCVCPHAHGANAYDTSEGCADTTRGVYRVALSVIP